MKRRMRASTSRTCLKLFLIPMLTLMALQTPSVSAIAQDRYVSPSGSDTANTCTSISNPCATVSHAIAQAVAGDHIHIFAGTYNSVHFTVDKTLNFYGMGGKDTTILDGGYSGRVVSLNAGLNVIFTDLTIRNGNTDAGGLGGGIYQPYPTTTLTLMRVNVTGNTAHFGAGIYSGGTLNILDSEISNNSANLSDGSGGALFLLGTGLSANLTDVTIRENSSVGDSAGIHYQIDNSSGGLTMLINVTISHNMAKTSAAGKIAGNGKVTFINSTIANNHITGGTGSNTGGFTNFGTVKIANSIFAYNDDKNCNVSGSSWTSYGNNIDSGSTCGFSNATYHDMQNTNPRLGPLGTTADSVYTMALLRGSPAIDGVIYLAPNAAPAYDARLVPRPFGSAYDIGAYESNIAAWVYLPLIKK